MTGTSWESWPKLVPSVPYLINNPGAGEGDVPESKQHW